MTGRCISALGWISARGWMRWAVVLVVLSGTLRSAADDVTRLAPANKASDERADEQQGLDSASVDLLKLAEREKSRDPRIRYVLASVKLAKLNLRTVLEARQRDPQAVSTTEMQRVRQAYNLAVTELKNVMQTRRGNGVLQQAEAAVKLARNNLEETLAASRSRAEAADETQIERLRLALDMAEAQLAIQQSTGDVRSVMAEMQQRLDQLTDEVAQLRRQVGRGVRVRPADASQADAPAAQ